MQFASLFKAMCKEKGVTQIRALTDLGLTRNATQNWKESRPGTDTLEKMAAYFGVSVDSLLRSDRAITNSINNTSNSVVIQGSQGAKVTTGDIRAASDDLTEQEAEILRIFRLMSIKERTRLLMDLYDWEAKHKGDKIE